MRFENVEVGTDKGATTAGWVVPIETLFDVLFGAEKRLVFKTLAPMSRSTLGNAVGIKPHTNE